MRSDARKRLTGEGGKVPPPEPKTARAAMWLHAHDEEIREEAYRRGFEDGKAAR